MLLTPFLGRTFLALNLLQEKDTDASCPIGLPNTCSNSTPIENSCCFESPGGILLQTQFWDYNPAIGGNETFTLHGLWPDNCDGTYEQFCDDDLDISNAKLIVQQFDQQLYDDMSTYWKDYKGNDESLWEHEFNKHGTCVKTIRPKCYGDYKDDENVYDYYKIAMTLYKKLSTYEFLKGEGIVPSNDKTYTKSEVANALQKNFGKLVYFKCDSDHALQEVWYYHYLNGPLTKQDFIPIDTISQSKCPDTGIKFVPKGSSGGGGGGGNNPPSNAIKGYLKLSDGCIISNGKYFTKGTCATFRKQPAEHGGYNLLSSKGTCHMEGDTIVCNKASSKKTQFNFNDNTVGYNNKFKWCISGNNDQKDISLSDGNCDEFEIKFTGMN